jgi:hypothetical protein
MHVWRVALLDESVSSPKHSREGDARGGSSPRKREGREEGGEGGEGE